LLTTCGFSYMGAPCVDEDRPLGLHGRAANIPAQEVKVETGWDGDDYIIGVQGKVVESSVYGVNLVLTRSIFAFMGQNKLHIHDEVQNEGHEPAPHMMLYHINYGFPAVGAGSRLAAPSLTVTPRDAEAEKEKEDYGVFSAPRNGFKEKVYFHDVADDRGKTLAGVVNPDLGFGAYVGYSKAQLPHLIEWKMMGKGTYVVGVEPGTNLVCGRALEREEGRLRMLKPGETAVYDLELGALASKQECAEFEKVVAKLRGRRRTVIGSAD